MRKKTIKVAFRELRTEVTAIVSNDQLALVERCNQAMSLVVEFLAFVKDEKTTSAFKDKFEEIYFFKFEKPEYFAQRIFLAEWFAILMEKPRGTNETICSYYLQELNLIDRFFKKHAFHYSYFRSGFTEMDELLFMRGADISHVLLPEMPELDPNYSTAGDYLFAKFMAFELLQEFILQEIKKLERPSMSIANLPTPKLLNWTGEIINVVELGYALYVSKQINDGKASLSEIFRWLEQTFGLEIGIPANRLREIKRRKRLNRLHFMELMQELLTEYIDRDDALPNQNTRLN